MSISGLELPRDSGLAVSAETIQNAILDLAVHDVPKWLATKVAKAYGSRWKAELAEQTFGAYALSFTFGGSFAVADKVGKGLFKLDAQAEQRVAAGAFQVLLEELQEGHCYQLQHSLCREVSVRLGVPQPVVETTLTGAHGYPIVFDGKRVLLRWIAEDETTIAAAIKHLRQQPPAIASVWVPHDDVLELSPEQADAVTMIQAAPVGVVTGGPGTGKTTSLREACAALPNHCRLALCAPTGKAARRMFDSTGLAATTIHKLLEYHPQLGYRRNRYAPLDVDLVIVDESSMLDVRLTARLLQALPPHARIVFVGDVNQLPPVGPGAFFRDLIDSSTVPVVRLHQVHRQKAGSWVACNAPRILAGEKVELTDRPDFEYWRVGGDPGGLGDVVGEVLEALYTQGVEPHELCVLTPRKTPGVPGSTADLNRQLQAQFNAGGQPIALSDRELRVGDRVIQTRNDYDRDVMNGDLGVISGVGYDRRNEVLGAEVLVGDLSPRAVRQALLEETATAAPAARKQASSDAFERMLEQLRAAVTSAAATEPALENAPRTVVYDRAELQHLELGYALTIHKSQGSEWPVVIVVCHSVHGRMLTRKLLYTALTRASQKVVLIGDEAGVHSALTVVRDDSRRTLLRRRLCE
jgi:exodeoxyribonuclease V alpha subunit